MDYIDWQSPEGRKLGKLALISVLMIFGCGTAAALLPPDIAEPLVRLGVFGAVTTGVLGGMLEFKLKQRAKQQAREEAELAWARKMQGLLGTTNYINQPKNCSVVQTRCVYGNVHAPCPSRDPQNL